jgi:hypothetical protein
LSITQKSRKHGLPVSSVPITSIAVDVEAPSPSVVAKLPLQQSLKNNGTATFPVLITGVLPENIQVSVQQNNSSLPVKLLKIGNETPNEENRPSGLECILEVSAPGPCPVKAFFTYNDKPLQGSPIDIEIVPPVSLVSSTPVIGRAGKEVSVPIKVDDDKPHSITNVEIVDESGHPIEETPIVHRHPDGSVVVDFILLRPGDFAARALVDGVPVEVPISVSDDSSPFLTFEPTVLQDFTPDLDTFIPLDLGDFKLEDVKFELYNPEGLLSGVAEL